MLAIFAINIEQLLFQENLMQFALVQIFNARSTLLGNNANNEVKVSALHQKCY